MLKSADAEVRSLIDAAGAGNAVAREAAVARLIIVGERAVGRVAEACSRAKNREQHLALLRVLEASNDDRALPPARRALAAGGELAVAGIAVLRELLARGTGSTQTAALDALLATSGDCGLERRVRAAAAEALAGAPEDIRRAVAPALPPVVVTANEALWQDALEGRLPDAPAALTEAIAQYAGGVSLPELQRLLERLRMQEAAAPAACGGWREARGAVHHALAARGSRVALYDLRETLEQGEAPLPASFLAALREIGEASCLESIAAAHARADRDDCWRASLADAFSAILRRERLTKRHQAVRRALAKSPGLEHGAQLFSHPTAG